MDDKVPNNFPEREKIYSGSIVIFHKHVGTQSLFLVVENSNTRNISFVSGAQEESDASPLATAQREIQEELGLQPEEYTLRPTTVKHDFVFGPNKPERSGHKGSYQVFLAEVKTPDTIGHTQELSGIRWMTKEETFQKLSFPDLKEVFEKVLQEVGL